MAAITQDILQLAEEVRGAALRRVEFQAYYFRPHKTQDVPTKMVGEFIHQFYDIVAVEEPLNEVLKDAGDPDLDITTSELADRLQAMRDKLQSQWLGVTTIRMNGPFGSYQREAEVLQGLEKNTPPIMGLKKTNGMVQHWLRNLNRSAPLSQVVVEMLPLCSGEQRFEASASLLDSSQGFGVILPKAAIKRLN